MVAEFDSQLVKVTIAEVLRRELATERVRPEWAAFGTSTDPYQRAEGRYPLLPPIIDALAGARISFSIRTKESVIRRNLDQLAVATQRANVELLMSIAFLDEALQRLLVEPGAPSTVARLITLCAMRDAGLAHTVPRADPARTGRSRPN
ncbi:hypothetical protein GA0070624_4361 [Micromonospora rhizosphaerae]|uniref:Uncharacterized protein n=1 Tax=Micromonospora rhizosphaerae TaxID=568872 RepID=A0A1C6SQZ0_9ACTN|nr:hypothetical protein [Micromonospora rhizosphaerae]SCL31928.1 hypothetical protein GA0070624_4361 [Micromonospora rhizosphaerae]